MTVKADVEVLKTQIETIKGSFDDHVAQNREDFKEVHSRMSTMKREISDEINLTFEKLYDKIDENEKDIGGKRYWWNRKMEMDIGRCNACINFCNDCIFNFLGSSHLN